MPPQSLVKSVSTWEISWGQLLASIVHRVCLIGYGWDRSRICVWFIFQNFARWSLCRAIQIKAELIIGNGTKTCLQTQIECSAGDFLDKYKKQRWILTFRVPFAAAKHLFERVCRILKKWLKITWGMRNWLRLVNTAISYMFCVEWI